MCQARGVLRFFLDRRPRKRWRGRAFNYGLSSVVFLRKLAFRRSAGPRCSSSDEGDSLSASPCFGAYCDASATDAAPDTRSRSGRSTSSPPGRRHPQSTVRARLQSRRPRACGDAAAPTRTALATPGSTRSDAAGGDVRTPRPCPRLDRSIRGLAATRNPAHSPARCARDGSSSFASCGPAGSGTVKLHA